MIASTCLLVAAKFFDRKLPPLSELVKVHHNKTGAQEFADLELKILQALRWKLHVPLPHVFTEPLRSLCVGAPFTPQIEDRMMFFIDLSVYGTPRPSDTRGAVQRGSSLSEGLHRCCTRLHPAAPAPPSHSVDPRAVISWQCARPPTHNARTLAYAGAPQHG